MGHHPTASAFTRGASPTAAAQPLVPVLVVSAVAAALGSVWLTLLCTARRRAKVVAAHRSAHYLEHGTLEPVVTGGAQDVSSAVQRAMASAPAVVYTPLRVAAATLAEWRARVVYNHSWLAVLGSRPEQQLLVSSEDRVLILLAVVLTALAGVAAVVGTSTDAHGNFGVGVGAGGVLGGHIITVGCVIAALLLPLSQCLPVLLSLGHRLTSAVRLSLPLSSQEKASALSAVLPERVKPVPQAAAKAFTTTVAGVGVGAPTLGWIGAGDCVGAGGDGAAGHGAKPSLDLFSDVLGAVPGKSNSGGAAGSGEVAGLKVQPGVTGDLLTGTAPQRGCVRGHCCGGGGGGGGVKVGRGR